MAKLTRAQLQGHNHAMEMLNVDRDLTIDERFAILERYHEGATHSNAATSAFFTPVELATHFAMEVPAGGHILDLCAGIGALSVATLAYHQQNPGRHKFTLVELDPEYCKVARRLLPDATVICGSIFDPDVQAMLRKQRYDVAIANPPYGTLNAANGAAPRYTGKKCEYSVIDVASDLADIGVFLIPQESVPFKMSGVSQNTFDNGSEAYQKFQRETHIELQPNMGIDTSFAEKQWRGTSIRTEIALCDFREVRAARTAAETEKTTGQTNLFSAAA
ncbi:methyltransferase [Erythrobacter aureus]|uniref:Methyltransferase n=1 Tax=Erythrobacter aureus TaxID=2182384 RepID=A0A345YIJ2_9SPHN|nr:methyltransferase [Erythrobacter aureus]AXK43744.1 methyltransferase [Erythrobacter aureus]